MIKFGYKPSTSMDLDTITKKASNFIVNKRSLTNKYSNFITFSEYFDSITETDNNLYSYSGYNRSMRINFRDTSTVLPNNLKSMWGITGNNYSFKYTFPLIHGGGKFDKTTTSATDKQGKNLYTTTMINNVFLGVHQGRIYTVLQHCVDIENGTGFVAVESYPLELLYSSFTKDYYCNHTYNQFDRMFNDRTITIIPPQGEAFTFQPCNLSFIDMVSPVGFRKSLGENRTLLVSRITNQLLSNKTFFSEKHSYSVCSILYSLSLILPVEVVDDIAENLPSSEVDDITDMIASMTLYEFVDTYSPESLSTVKECIKTIFSVDITKKYTMKQLFAIIGVSQLSNGINGVLFFSADEFMGYDTDDYFTSQVLLRKLPIKSLINTEGFIDGRLVKMVYNDDTDECVFTYTPNGRKVVDRLIERQQKINGSESVESCYIEELLNSKLLSMCYYLSEPFLREVAYPTYVDKENIKTFLKGCYYE